MAVAHGAMAGTRSESWLSGEANIKGLTCDYPHSLSSRRWLVTSPRGMDGRTAGGSFHLGPWLEPRVTHD